MSFTWFWDWGIVLLFYVGIIALIYFNRSKFQFEGKIVALYRTKLGLKTMDKMAKPLSKGLDKFGRFLFFSSFALMVVSFILFFFWFGWASWLFYAFIVLFIISIVVFKQYRIAGDLGTWVGFVGMLLMVYLMVLGIFMLIAYPNADPLFSPIIPGIQIPGSPIKLPLLEGLLSLFVVVVVHEFSHGIVARTHGIKVKSSGFVLFGPIPGAFVEPDEKQLSKKKRKTQLAVFAAGPWSNVILSLILIVVLSLTTLLAMNIYEKKGVIISGFTNESDMLPGGRLSNFQEEEIIIGVDDFEITDTESLQIALKNRSPGESIHVKTNLGNKVLVLGANKNASLPPVLGIQVNHHVVAKNNDEFVAGIGGVYFWLFGNPYDTGMIQKLGLIGLIYVISLGIGLVNLLPLGPTDGGRMYLLVLQKFFKKKTAMSIWSKTASVLIILLVVLIFVPIIKEILGF